MLFQKHFVLMVRILTKIHSVYLPPIHPFLNFDSKILPPFLPGISRKCPSINWVWIVLSDFERQRWWFHLVIASGKRNSASVRRRFHCRERGAVLLCPCSQKVYSMSTAVWGKGVGGLCHNTVLSGGQCFSAISVPNTSKCFLTEVVK